MQLRPPTNSEAIIANARSIGPIIEEEADKFAKERRLTNDVVALMRRAGLFRIAFPKAWGGPEMDILSQCEVMETLGYHDASTAFWVAMICSDSGHYAARIEETEARTLYPSFDLLTAGAIGPTGEAHIVDDGLKVSGRWPFGSGCLHADRLVGGCVLFENGKPQMGAGGRPNSVPFGCPRTRCKSTIPGTQLGLPAAAATTIQCKTSSSRWRTAFIRFELALGSSRSIVITASSLQICRRSRSAARGA